MTCKQLIDFPPDGFVWNLLSKFFLVIGRFKYIYFLCDLVQEKFCMIYTGTGNY
jgi:hypothetical protein